MRNNLRNLRERRGLTLDEVEKATGISYSTLAKMETEGQTITEPNARLLADFYHVSLDYLFAREFEAPKPKEQEITFSAIIGRLPTFSNLELARLGGTIEGITNERLKNQTNGNGKIEVPIATPQGARKVV